MQFIIEPVKRKTKKDSKIKLQCPEDCPEYCPSECYCFDPGCGGHELCMDGLNCPTYCPRQCGGLARPCSPDEGVCPIFHP